MPEKPLATLQKPRVVLVGGPDVDARIPLMQQLAGAFEPIALGSTPALAARFAAAGFPYHDYPLTRRIDPFADLRSVRQLAARFRTLQPAIVHAFDTKPGVYGAIAARRARVPVVVTTVTGLGSLYAAHDFKTRLLRFVYQRLQRAACRRADATIFQNHDDARQLIAARVVPERKATVILGSGVATATFAPERVDGAARARLRRELGLEPDAVVVTMIARVTRTKGVFEFMAAAQQVRARCPAARFLLVGPDDEDSLDRLTPAELETLRKTLVWPGPRRDIPTVLASSDVFVLPSAYREGIPRVLLEAASMGLPLVTTDSPGCNEVVEHGTNGFLVAVGDAGALAMAVERLAAAPELRRRFGAVSRARAVARFDLGVIAGQIADLYRRLLGAAPPRPAAAARAGYAPPT